MYRVFILLCLSFASLHAAEVLWAHSFKEALLKAQTEDKNLMVLITTESCRWCRKLESETLKDGDVISRLNADYVSVHLTRDVDEYPRYLNAPGVPATYFLNRAGQPIIKRVMGYWNAEDYLSYLDDVDYKLGKKDTLGSGE
jgi:thioredoxin-related protein